MEYKEMHLPFELVPFYQMNKKHAEQMLGLQAAELCVYNTYNIELILTGATKRFRSVYMQSIGVYLHFDMEGNVIINPMLQDPIGFGRLSCKFIKLQKGYAAFSKRHKCVSINYVLEKEGYRVTAQKRYKDGSYGYDQEDIPLRVKEYAGRPSAEAIAEQVFEALKIV